MNNEEQPELWNGDELEVGCDGCWLQEEHGQALNRPLQSYNVHDTSCCYSLCRYALNDSLVPDRTDDLSVEEGGQRPAVPMG